MMHLFGPIVLALSLLVIPAALAQTNDDLDARLTEVLAAFRADYGFPGATAAYVLADGTTGSVAVGFADVELQKPMTPDSRMLAASIGKTIWGALFLSLERDGLFNQTDHVSDHLGHLPWFHRLPNAQDLTLGQLLTHSAGIPDHVHMEGAAKTLIALSRTGQASPEQAIALVLDTDPLFPAGAGWSYCDTGYLLLGLVIEEVTDEDVFTLAQNRLLTPLALTGVTPSDRTNIQGLAVGYTEATNPFGLPPRTMDDQGTLLWNPAIEWTGGGFAATSLDLARWGHALFTGQALDGPYLDRLLAGVPVDPGIPGVLYGRGVAIYSDAPLGPVYGHGGWIPGYVSSLRHYPQSGITVAFQINSDIRMEGVNRDLVSSLETALAATLIKEPETKRKR